MSIEPITIPATLADYSVIQDMATSYIQDLSRTCGFISEDETTLPEGFYEHFDTKRYFEDSERHAFLVKVREELAGFALINTHGTTQDVDWNMGELFILPKFQRKGIGQQVATQIFRQFSGLWEVAVIPENGPALEFWRKTINQVTKGHYIERLTPFDYDEHQPQRYVFQFKLVHSL